MVATRAERRTGDSVLVVLVLQLVEFLGFPIVPLDQQRQFVIRREVRDVDPAVQRAGYSREKTQTGIGTR